MTGDQDGVLARRTPAALAVLFGLLAVLPIVLMQIPGTVTKNVGEYLPGAGQQAFHLLQGDAYTPGPWQGLGAEVRLR